jgi:hypothetical protein
MPSRRRRRKSRAAGGARGARRASSSRAASARVLLNPFLNPLAVALPVGFRVHLLLPGMPGQSNWYSRSSSLPYFANLGARESSNEMPLITNSNGSLTPLPDIGGGVVGTLLRP